MLPQRASSATTGDIAVDSNAAPKAVMLIDQCRAVISKRIIICSHYSAARSPQVLFSTYRRISLREIGVERWNCRSFFEIRVSFAE